MNLDKLHDSIRRHEGLKNYYRDTKGKMTVGLGRNLDDNPLTEEEAWFLVKGPLDDAIEHAPLLVHNWASLGDARQNILVELVYNIGLTKALKFRGMRAALDAGDWAKAADELLDSQWKVDVGPQRSAEMANQLELGTFA